MKKVFADLADEVRTVFKGKTLDAIFPTLLFVVVNVLFSLSAAVIVALVSGALLFLYRYLKKSAFAYALFGLLGVLFASLYALYAGRASDYFLPQLLGSASLIALTLLTVVVRRPLAAWLSHITRSFPLEWYWREDIRPAYQEVTLMWLALLTLRFFVLLNLFLGEDLVRLAWANTLLGFPVTFLVLLLSYLYGIWRLKTLKGPSVEEYVEGAKPPFKGQTKGF